MPYDRESFDHLFVCFVLEHLARPVEALVVLRDFLKASGTITVIEGDTGRRIFIRTTTLHGRPFAASSICSVLPDWSRPRLVEGFTRKTFTAMVEGVREPAIAAGMIGRERFDAGIRALYRTAEPDGGLLLHVLQGGRAQGAVMSIDDRSATTTSSKRPPGSY